MSNYVFKGDIGTELRFDVGVSADDITVAKIYYKKPDGTTGVWEATPVSGTTEIKYIVQEGDFDQEGIWKLQPYIEIPNWKGRGSIVNLSVQNVI